MLGIYLLIVLILSHHIPIQYLSDAEVPLYVSQICKEISLFMFYVYRLFFRNSPFVVKSQGLKPWPIWRECLESLF
jgi:hypothetical protein